MHSSRSLVTVLAVCLSACGTTTTSGTGGGSATGGGTTATGGGTTSTGGGSAATGGGSATGGGDAGTVIAGVTWHKDVSPIVQRSCLGCHVTGGLGPFSMESYAQAKPMAASISDAVATRRMPPWLADPACGGPFLGSRRLPQVEVDTITSWVAAGAPEGNPADAPPPQDAGVPTLAHVDADLAMATPYTPDLSLTDDYRCFILDPALAASTQVTGYDITPGVRGEVHHVILYVVDRATAIAKDAQDATPGWQCFGGANINSTGALGAWAPGSGAVVYPTGGITLKSTEVLAMQVHYNNTTGVHAPDTSAVKLMYATTPVTQAYLLPLVASGFSIPPNSTGYTFSKAFPNPVPLPLKVWGLLPHMHTLGKHIRIRGAADACLIDIPKWDFHWQMSYFTATPSIVGSADSLTVDCTWDNPSANTIQWGESTSDEMCFAYVYVTP